jgi:drug/metabolite transporter (DMT)-like permease
MSLNSHHKWPGVPLAMASAALFGLSTPIAKALQRDLSPALLAGVLYLGSGLGLLVVNRVQRAVGTATEAAIRHEDWPWLSAIVLTGGVLGPLLLMWGLTVTPASSTSLLLNLEGVLTLGLAWIVFQENVDLRVGFGAAAIVLAAALLSWTEDASGTSWGSLAIAGACVAWAIDNNLTRRLSTTDPVQLAMVKGLAAGTFNVVLAVILGSRWPGVGTIASAAALGFAGYGVSLVCFILALRHLGAARTSAYFSFAPFVGASASILMFADPITARFVVAGGLMAIGLYFHMAERHEHLHVHEPMAHEHRHVHDAHHQHAHGPNDPPGEPHTHWHEHGRLVHSHSHYPDIHHRHDHVHPG